MQECSQLYYNYTILLLNFRRSCRGSTRSSARNWRETWRELPNFPSNKGHLRALFDCRIHSFTFVFLTSKTTPSLNISPRSRSSRHDLPPSPTYLLSKLRYFHESRIASYHIDMARFTSAIPENRFIKFISLSVPNWTNRSKRHYLAGEKKKKKPKRIRRVRCRKPILDRIVVFPSSSNMFTPFSIARNHSEVSREMAVEEFRTWFSRLSNAGKRHPRPSRGQSTSDV